jgi:hypothetical protein
MVSNYQDQVKRITNLFVAIEKQSRSILFPTERTGIFVRPNIGASNKSLQFAYRLSHPYSAEKGPGILDAIALPVMFILAWLTFAMAFGMIYITAVSPNNSVILSTPADNILMTLCGGIGILLSLISYYWWFEGLTTKRYTIGEKLFVLISFVVFLLIVSNAFKHIGIHQYSGNTLAIYIILVIPSLTYFFAIGLDAFVEVLYTTKIGFYAIRSLHNPLQIGNIQSLVTENIHLIARENQIWKLGDLSPNEISTLREWSQANRDATVHRLIPTSVVITILTLIGISDTARSWTDHNIQIALDVFAKFLINPFSDAFWPGIGISLILIPVIWFMKYLARLFENIAVQNLIIETCIVARHARQVELESQKIQKTSISFENVIAWVANLFKFGN